MRKIISVLALTLALGANQAWAQTGGGAGGGGAGTGTSSPSGTGAGPVQPNTGGPTSNPNASTGSTGSTGSTVNTAIRPSPSQCQSGWSSGMKWSESEFKSLCGS
jgi:hypothetical protein